MANQRNGNVYAISQKKCKKVNERDEPVPFTVN